METLNSLRAQANAGSPQAQLRLAHLMLVGRAPAYSLQEPLQLIEAACALKHSEAFLYQAALAARGHGRPQDFAAAFAYVAQAAAAGDTRAKGQLMALGGDKFDRAAWFGDVKLEQHCEAPRIFTVRNFLPKPVCAWLIKLSRKNLQRAPVQSAAQGGAFTVHSARSNSVAGSNPLQPDLALQLTNLRIAHATGLALENQEPTNFLHYARNQEYRPHYDFFTAAEEAGFAHELRTIGQRVCTVLVYLNDGYEGGHTEFPKLGFSFRGEVGDALIFWNLDAQGAREMNSLHAGLPVTKGEKWLLSKWIRQRPVPLG